MTETKRLHSLSATTDVAHDLPQRLRRLRKSDAIRSLLQENHLNPQDFIYPVFVEENLHEPIAIPSLPGIMRQTEDSLKTVAKNVKDHDVPAMMLFGVSHNKDHSGTDSLKPDGLMARMIDRVKQASPETLVIADGCFCEYTDHGHCGPLDEDGDVNNDRTLENLSRQAVIAAQAGADIIAPSGMMDGMVLTIRDSLDRNGYSNIPILSYAAKFASAFYGPFRDAAGCSLGDAKSHNARSDRKTYQMNPANAREAMREVEADIMEGADMVMVKPGLPYLDIIRQIRDTYDHPLAAYHVSGEYAMLKAAAEKGWLDNDTALMETLMSFKRAGADMIVTYAALDAVKLLRA